MVTPIPAATHDTPMREFKSATGKTYLTISHDKKNRWIYNNWTGYVSTDNVKVGSTSFLEVLQQTGCAFTLIDNRELVGPWDQSLEWIKNEWVPAAKKVGLRFYAHVVNKDTFAEAAALQMQDFVKGEFEMRVFYSMPDAQEWLQQQMSVPI
ncbi:hypothetical protein SAMN04487941_3195 [Pontibacter akesuensis]|uniref:SpoIIAA-like n=2 Tax=Pontibacter akesuensis TaxID=388950 RepID=A0A1I7JYI3_9BACT|nr:STAS/SEC14 domain-containing protein [Pontibacter akesuensis]SFU90290.1 hypothetical protein SAMN04487941_3195 [Pontibacter akesuensis]